MRSYAGSPKLLILGIFLGSALAGCLTNSGGKLNVNPLLESLPLFGPVCKLHEGPLVNASTGRVDDVCNVAVSTGPRPTNEPSIAINPANPNHLAAGGNDYNLGSVWAGVYVSKDAGATWSHSYIPGYPGGPVSALTGNNAAGDPALAFGPDGTLYYAGISTLRHSGSAGTTLTGSVGIAASKSWDLFVARSPDGGVAWDLITVAQKGIGASVGVSSPLGSTGLEAELLNDKEYITVGPDGTVYVTWTAYELFPEEIAPVKPSRAPIKLIKSMDRGASWSTPVTVSRTDDNQGSVPVVTPDGTLIVTWAEGSSDGGAQEHILVRTSHDQGATFGPVGVVASVTRTVDASHHTRSNSFPSIAADVFMPSRPRLAVVWAANETGDADVFLSISTDMGATWTPPVRVNQDPLGNGRDQLIPWVAASPDGAFHIVYWDGREDPRNQHLATYVASTQDGIHFAEQPVTDAPFLADQDGFTGDNFLGDYLGIAASKLGVYPIWPDTRSATSGLGDTDLYTVRLVAQTSSGGASNTR